MENIVVLLVYIFYGYLFLLPGIGIIQLVLAITVSCSSAEAKKSVAPMLKRYWIMVGFTLGSLSLLWILNSFFDTELVRVITEYTLWIFAIIIPSAIAIYFSLIVKKYYHAKKS